MGKGWRSAVKICLCVLPLLLSEPLLAGGMITKVSGSAARRWRAGVIVPDDLRFDLRQGDEIQFVTSSGTRVFKGPQSFRLADASKPTSLNFEGLNPKTGGETRPAGVTGVSSNAAELASTTGARSPEQIVCEITGDCSGELPVSEGQIDGKPSSAGFSFTRPAAKQAAAPAASAPRKSYAPAPVRTASRSNQPRPAYDRAVRAERRSTEMRVNFALGSADILPDSRPKIENFAKELKSIQLADQRFLVAGHADSTGPRDRNLTLSQERADAVAALLRAQGIDTTRLEPKGFGSEKPLPGHSRSSPQNRRVELVPIGKRFSNVAEIDIQRDAKFCDLGMRPLVVRSVSVRPLTLTLREPSGLLTRNVQAGEMSFEWNPTVSAPGDLKPRRIEVADPSGARVIEIKPLLIGDRTLAQVIELLQAEGCSSQLP